MNIIVFVSGRGSNLQAILNSKELKESVKVIAVISDKIDCQAFDIAKNNSIKTFSIGDKPGFISYDDLILALQQYTVDLVVLAGFLKLIPAKFIQNFEGKIINIHPALLPSFGGKGMYGKNVHKAVFESSAKISGATVHFVDETFDTGRIIAQQCVDISDCKSPEEIAEKVLVIEHNILPTVIKKISEGKVKIIGKRVIIN